MKTNIILQIYDKPFRLDDMSMYIFDRNDKMVLEIRWWGALQKLKNWDKIQDEIWEEIVKLLNNL